MAPKSSFKKIIEVVPYPVGRVLARVPFSWRLGEEYKQTKQLCVESESWSSELKERYAVEHFRKIFKYAREKFPCYRELYERAGVLNLEVNSLADIAKVPQIDKQWTRRHFKEFKGVYRLNTGGSSGEPTAFWMDKDCWAREWAHMHTIWERLGYKYTDLKLAIRGKNLGSRPFVYNPVHNEYIINTYLNVRDYAPHLKELFAKRNPQWFHGYPSSIYQFIIECESSFGRHETAMLFKNVRGLLLSSEYPHPNLLQKFAEYDLKWVSWYGHSEMAVLAYADEEMVCHPFITYGLAEVVDGHLLGTSYHNFDMPLIRYDTGDLVEAVSDGFKIKEGRSGDFIEDKNGKKIPLTALIFGRHHKAFDVADYIQIGQAERGTATIYVTLKTRVDGELERLFDLTNVDIDFQVKAVDAPIRTVAGKLKLRV